MLEGRWHVVIGQECEGHLSTLQIRSHLRLWNGLVVAFNKNTFDDNIIWHEYENINPFAEIKKESHVMRIGKVQFRRPAAGVT